MKKSTQSGCDRNNFISFHFCCCFCVFRSGRRHQWSFSLSDRLKSINYWNEFRIISIWNNVKRRSLQMNAVRHPIWSFKIFLDKRFNQKIVDDLFSISFECMFDSFNDSFSTSNQTNQINWFFPQLFSLTFYLCLPPDPKTTTENSRHRFRNVTRGWNKRASVAAIRQ